MVGIIITAILGLSVGYLIGKFTGQQPSNEKRTEIDELYRENEKFRNRNRDFERQVEDLLAENKKLYRQLKEREKDNDSFEDEMDAAKRKIKALSAENSELKLKVEEYSLAVKSLENEVELLKK